MSDFDKRHRSITNLVKSFTFAIFINCHYAEGCIAKLLELRGHVADGSMFPEEQSNPDYTDFPADAISIFRDCIEVGDAEHNERLAEIVSNLQVQSARLRTPERKIHRLNIDAYNVGAVELID